MRYKLLLAIVLVFVLVLSSCSGSEPPPESGYVRNKDFVPEHWEDGYRSESRYGPHCGLSYDGKFDCSSKFYTEQVYEEHHRWVENTWKLYLEDCDPPDEKGKEHCNRGWIEVTETMYNSHSLNSHYPDAR